MEYKNVGGWSVWKCVSHAIIFGSVSLFLSTVAIIVITIGVIILHSQPSEYVTSFEYMIGRITKGVVSGEPIGYLWATLALCFVYVMDQTEVEGE